MRQSYSLNRISEIHEAEQSEAEEDQAETCRTPGQAESGGGGAEGRPQFTPQLSSESEGENNEILTRYLLDSLGRHTTEDSLNSSDSEYNTEEDRRRNKVNLRHLEERLNMIQEECNRSDDVESDDERSATIDDQSERNEQLEMLETNNDDSASASGSGGEEEEEEDHLDQTLLVNKNMEFESVFNKIDQFLDNSKLSRRNSGRSRSEGKNGLFSDQIIISCPQAGHSLRVMSGSPPAPTEDDQDLPLHEAGNLSTELTAVAL